MKSKYLFPLVLLAISCKSPDTELFQINPNNWSENKINLAEIADDITYTPLDNSSPLSVLNTRGPLITNKNIFLFVPNSGFVEFNRKGELIRKIGSWGRGPDEYMSLNLTLDDKTGTIYIKDTGNRIKVYSKNGNFIKEISLKQYGEYFHKVDVYNSKLFVSEFPIGGEAKYDWIILDTIGNLIAMKKNSLPVFEDNTGLAGVTYRFDNKIYYSNFYNDTVFSILPDLSYKAAFLFSPGEYRWPRGKVTLDKIAQYIYPMGLFETNRFIVYSYGSNKINAVAYIDKKSKKTFINFRGRTSGGIIGILNDIDCGIMFDVVFSSYFVENKKEFLVGLIDTYQLKAHIASDEFKNSAPKYPEKKKELEKLANSLNEADNPILMLVRLKK